MKNGIVDVCVEIQRIEKWESEEEEEKRLPFILQKILSPTWNRSFGWEVGSTVLTAILN